MYNITYRAEYAIYSQGIGVLLAKASASQKNCQFGIIAYKAAFIEIVPADAAKK